MLIAIKSGCCWGGGAIAGAVLALSECQYAANSVNMTSSRLAGKVLLLGPESLNIWVSSLQHWPLSVSFLPGRNDRPRLDSFNIILATSVFKLLTVIGRRGESDLPEASFPRPITLSKGFASFSGRDASKEQRISVVEHDCLLRCGELCPDHCVDLKVNTLIRNSCVLLWPVLSWKVISRALQIQPCLFDSIGTFAPCHGWAGVGNIWCASFQDVLAFSDCGEANKTLLMTCLLVAFESVISQFFMQGADAGRLAAHHSS